MIEPAFSGLGRIQRHGGANQSFQSFLVDLLTFMEVDSTPHSALETGIEEARGIIQKGAFGECHLYRLLVGLAGADDAVVRPHGVLPLPLFDDFRVGLPDQRAQAASISPRQSASSSIFASMRRDADSRDGDSTFGERLFFIGVSASFASWSILTLLDAFTDLFLCQEARFRRADFNGPGSSRRNTCCNNNLGGGESFEHAEESNKVRKIDSGLIR
jgi:hypothetical protein